MSINPDLIITSLHFNQSLVKYIFKKNSSKYKKKQKTGFILLIFFSIYFFDMQKWIKQNRFLCDVNYIAILAVKLNIPFVFIILFASSRNV